MKSKLFKDKLTITDTEKDAKALLDAINGGESALKKLLFGMGELTLYSKVGSYRSGQHRYCSGFENPPDDYEKRICKCIYYRNSHNENIKRKKNCEGCILKDKYSFEKGQYQVIDYEVPAFYYGSGIGKIDLVLSDTFTGKVFATEVKPPQNNNETILRMISEILTYTLGFENKYEKAIAFFEGSAQEKEYNALCQSVKRIIALAEIAVFKFEKTDVGYRICRL